jgi:hypothetical protein
VQRDTDKLDLDARGLRGESPLARLLLLDTNSSLGLFGGSSSPAPAPAPVAAPPPSPAPAPAAPSDAPSTTDTEGEPARALPHLLSHARSQARAVVGSAGVATARSRASTTPRVSSSANRLPRWMAFACS